MKAVARPMTISPGTQIDPNADSTNLVTLVSDESVRAIVRSLKPGLRSIILTGSMARGESTFTRTGAGWKTMGDCEMVLVYGAQGKLPDSKQVAEVQREIEAGLEQQGLACPVGMSPVHPRYLSTLPRHIYGYELRHCGRVLWGDSGILSLVPQYASRDIPREDAWRLLCNRMIEQLGIAEDGDPSVNLSASTTDYRTVKLCLDLATSFLLFYGEYAPTYRDRNKRLQRLSESRQRLEGLPFSLQPFAELVDTLTRWKLSPESEKLEADPLLLRATVWEYARRLWRWELQRLTGDSGVLSDSGLMSQWMRSQPVPRRLRGWASLARKQGWFSSWRQWPRWFRLGMRGSPRYWIYGAGSELFFQLPALVEEREAPCPDGFLRKCGEGLPVRPQQLAEKQVGWQQLASEIHWNYRHFLMETYS